MKTRLVLILFLVTAQNLIFSQAERVFNLRYDFNQVTPIDNQQFTTFKEFINLYSKATFKAIKVEAYSDSIGSEENNLKIGVKRYNFVNAHLNKISNLPPITFVNHGSGTQRRAKIPSEKARLVVVWFTFEEENITETDIVAVNDVFDSQETVIASVQEQTFDKEQVEKEAIDYRNKTMITSVQFEGDKGKYFGNPTPELRKIYMIYKQDTSLRLKITGHTCCGDMVRLSKRRAKKVYKDLKKEGIPKQKMSYEGWGNKRPLVLEVDENARQRNRRVEITFY